MSLCTKPSISMKPACKAGTCSRCIDADRPTASSELRKDGMVSAGAPIRVQITVIGKYDENSSKSNAPFGRSEEHTSELQSLMRISYAVFCLKKQTTIHPNHSNQ